MCGAVVPGMCRGAQARRKGECVRHGTCLELFSALPLGRGELLRCVELLLESGFCSRISSGLSPGGARLLRRSPCCARGGLLHSARRLPEAAVRAARAGAWLKDRGLNLPHLRRRRGEACLQPPVVQLELLKRAADSLRL